MIEEMMPERAATKKTRETTACLLALACSLLPALGCRRQAPEKDKKASAPTSLPFRVPLDSEIPVGDPGDSIRRGKDLLTQTRVKLPGQGRAALNCSNCHLEAGTKLNALPWIGVYAHFPQFRDRGGRMNTLEDRINDCFLRSLNGRTLPPKSAAMDDIVAYLAFLSTGIPAGAQVEGGGLGSMPMLKGESGRGERVYALNCVHCHGLAGGGTRNAPPVWGPKSYNVAAGMARANVLASFIRYNMPPGSIHLSDQEAADAAAYIDSRPRPDFAGKENDWPNGNAPPDVPYKTRGIHARGNRK